MFQLIPLINSLRYSLTNIKLGGDYRFIGLQNYIRMFTSDVDLFNSMWVTIKYIVMVVPAKLIFALAVAMILSMKLKGIRLFRTMYYLPSILGGSVAISALWRVMFMKTGIVNNLLGTNINWLGDPKLAYFVVAFMIIWKSTGSLDLQWCCFSRHSSRYQEIYMKQHKLMGQEESGRFLKSHFQ